MDPFPRIDTAGAPLPNPPDVVKSVPGIVQSIALCGIFHSLTIAVAMCAASSQAIRQIVAGYVLVSVDRASDCLASFRNSPRNRHFLCTHSPSGQKPNPGRSRDQSL